MFFGYISKIVQHGFEGEILNISLLTLPQHVGIDSASREIMSLAKNAKCAKFFFIFIFYVAPIDRGKLYVARNIASR